MRMSDAFPSNYLRASDFPKPTLATMSFVKMEDIGEDHKPVLYFQEMEKGMVLNRTNGNTISEIYGEDFDDWKGQMIVLFEAPVEYKGKMGTGIRVRKPKPQARAEQSAPEPAPRPKPGPSRQDDMDDSIPF